MADYIHTHPYAWLRPGWFGRSMKTLTSTMRAEFIGGPAETVHDRGSPTVLMRARARTYQRQAGGGGPGFTVFARGCCAACDGSLNMLCAWGWTRWTQAQDGAGDAGGDGGD